jgi:cobalamin biosynthetic protein CobC
MGVEMRDHGGNLDAARATYGGADWIDLSTGINRVPWPVPEIPARAWADLPTRADCQRLETATRTAWGVSGQVVPLAGASQAIQLIPQVSPPGRARVLAPTYNEHAAALRSAGWQVREVSEPEALAGADLAVVVNPNNPDGRRFAPQVLLQLGRDVGQLVVDESFADPTPELSLAGQSHQPGLWVLRSFGKFYGLAGLRLGFVLAAEAQAEALRALAGPWPVSGPAIEIGARALADLDWRRASAARLAQDAARLDALSPWPLQGGTALFRLYQSPDAQLAQAQLAAENRNYMSDIDRLLTDPACRWSIGTGAAMMAFTPSGQTIGPRPARIARNGPTCLSLAAEPKILAFETISAAPRGWGQALALCVSGGAAGTRQGGRGAAPAPRGLVELGPDRNAIHPGDRQLTVFDLGGDAVARLMLRPEGAGMMTLRRALGVELGQILPDLAGLSGTWIVETALGRIEHWQAGGAPPVYLLHHKPSRSTPLYPGWRAAGHAFPAHPGCGGDDGFDRPRHDAFQHLLSRYGRPDLVALKSRVLTLLAEGRFERLAVDRHGAAVIRVALRQALARRGEVPPGVWLRLYDRPLYHLIRETHAG